MEYHRIAEIEVRYVQSKLNEVKIKTSQNAYNLALGCWNQDIIHLLEEFKLLLLNRGNQVLGIHTLSKGGIAGTIVDIRLIFGIALKATVSSIILLHNHPSGQLRPSNQDIHITGKIKQAGELLDIKVLDHLIISNQGYYSFSDEGIM